MKPTKSNKPTSKRKAKEVRRRQALKSPLQVLNPHAAGVDIGSREHYAAVPPEPGKQSVKCLGTTTPELQKLIAWFKECGITTVAMESTGVYWIPLYEMLAAEGIEAVLIDSRQLKSAPGRKSDVQDCQWIQQLHSCGLFRGAFRPEDPFCVLRSYTRQAKGLIDESSSKVQQMQKALTQMNVLVHHAVTDITGKTGMQIVRAIVAGQTDPDHLAQFRDPRCHKTKEEIAQALTGNFRPEHVFALQQALEAYDFLQQQLTSCEQRVTQTLKQLRPKTQAEPPPLSDPNKAKKLTREGGEPMRHLYFDFLGVDLFQVPGINLQAVLALLSEIGPTIKAFPSEKHFCSWLNCCPRRSITGGKVRKKPKRLAPNRLFAALRMAATSLKHADNYLGVFFRRKQARYGTAVAIKATAHKLARIIYHMITKKADYLDLGDHFEKAARTRIISHLKTRAKKLGYQLIPLPETPDNQISQPPESQTSV